MTPIFRLVTEIIFFTLPALGFFMQFLIAGYPQVRFFFYLGTLAVMWIGMLSCTNLVLRWALIIAFVALGVMAPMEVTIKTVNDAQFIEAARLLALRFIFYSGCIVLAMWLQNRIHAQN